MTGYELLKSQAMHEGLTAQQVNSKTFQVVFALCSQHPEMLKLFDIENEIEQRMRYLENIKSMIFVKNAEYERMCNRCQKITEEVNALTERRAKEEKAAEARITEFMNSVLECETPEGRDTMKTAQYFVNSIDVNSKYDNTAFIIGLAGILTKGGVNSSAELKKINTKLFERPNIHLLEIL